MAGGKSAEQPQWQSSSTGKVHSSPVFEVVDDDGVPLPDLVDDDEPPPLAKIERLNERERARMKPSNQVVVKCLVCQVSFMGDNMTTHRRSARHAKLLNAHPEIVKAGVFQVETEDRSQPTDHPVWYGPPPDPHPQNRPRMRKGTPAASPAASDSEKSERSDTGTQPRHCPDCQGLLTAVSITGGFRWDCETPGCKPIHPNKRLTDEQKAEMKKPGANPWSDFGKSMAGKGYSADQIRDMYRQKQSQGYFTEPARTAAQTGATGAASSAEWKPTPPVNVSKGKPKKTEPQTVINLNTATKEDLMSVDGIGPVLSLRILELRAKKGGFKRVQDLNEVEGLGRTTFGRIVHRFIVHT